MSSIPYERAHPRRRWSSAIRASLVATSIPPTPYQQGSPSTSSSEYRRDGILRDPAHRSGPVRLEGQPGCVRRRPAGLEERPLIDHEDVRLTPSSARWYAAEAPTMPAPTITVCAPILHGGLDAIDACCACNAVVAPSTTQAQVAAISLAGGRGRPSRPPPSRRRAAGQAACAARPASTHGCHTVGVGVDPASAPPRRVSSRRGCPVRSRSDRRPCTRTRSGTRTPPEPSSATDR